MKFQFIDKKLADAFVAKLGVERHEKFPRENFERAAEVVPILSSCGAAAVAWTVDADEKLSRTIFEEIMIRQDATATKVAAAEVKIADLEKTALETKP